MVVRDVTSGQENKVEIGHMRIHSVGLELAWNDGSGSFAFE